MFAALAVSGLIALNDQVQAIHVNAAVVTILVATVLPIIAGLVTKHSSKWTGPILLVLNAISAFVVKSTVPDGGAVFTGQALLFMAAGVATSIGMYYGAWKPLGVTNNPNNPTGEAKLGADKGLG